MTMLTDIDIFWQKEWHPFEYKDADRKQYGVYAIVIDEEIVDVCAYKKSFVDLYNNYEFVETEFSNGKYTIDVLSNDNFVVEQLEVSERLGAMLLSNPTIVPVTAETAYASIGMRYIDGEILRS